MVNRIIPPDPETNRQSQAKSWEEAQKIAAISSVDPDAQAKKRRFQEMMGVSEEKEKITHPLSTHTSSSAIPIPTFLLSTEYLLGFEFGCDSKPL